MTPSPILIEALPFTVPEREIRRRLGYVHGETVLSAEDEMHLKATIARGAALCRRSRGVYCAPLNIIQRTPETTTLDCGGFNWLITSPQVAYMLRDAKAVWAGAITLGPDIITAVNTAMNAKQTAEAAILDAVGSECADEVMNSLQKLATAQLIRHGWQLGQCRFSPGYGGWHLDAQKTFFKLLNLEQLQIHLTDSCIMLPEKSVTAIAPIF